MPEAFALRLDRAVARYTDDSRDRVRDAVDLVDLVGAHVQLRRARATASRGRCPFDEERTLLFWG